MVLIFNKIVLFGAKGTQFAIQYTYRDNPILHKNKRFKFIETRKSGKNIMFLPGIFR